MGKEKFSIASLFPGLTNHDLAKAPETTYYTAIYPSTAEQRKSTMYYKRFALKMQSLLYKKSTNLDWKPTEHKNLHWPGMLR